MAKESSLNRKVNDNRRRPGTPERNKTKQNKNSGWVKIEVRLIGCFYPY